MPDAFSKLRSVVTDKWVLDVPASTKDDAPLICIPTIHPRGDQRILRCAQAALNAGYRVKFFWLGTGVPSSDVAAAEEIFPRAHSLAERLTQLPRLAMHAYRHRPAGWHIHDFYMLPMALLVRVLFKTPIIYDVHEYYSVYYSAKLRLPLPLRRVIASFVDVFQVWSTKIIGGANVAAHQMADKYEARGIPVSISPNFPLSSYYTAIRLDKYEARRRRVIHTGTLSEPYGMKLIVDLAAECRNCNYDVIFDVVKRFPNSTQEEKFYSYLNNQGQLDNLRLIDPVSADQIPGLLSSYGIGLSMILAEGQNELAIPAKLYEYVLMGLSVVGTKRRAQEDFLQKYGVAELRDEMQIKELADAVDMLSRSQTDLPTSIEQKALKARGELFWESGPEPELRRLFARVFG